jgi:hypothetical protein
LYWVVGEDGAHKSKKPLPKERAMAQMRALYANVKDAKGEELVGSGMDFMSYYEAYLLTRPHF